MVLNIRDYGAVGDGISDDRQAILEMLERRGAATVRRIDPPRVRRASNI